MKKYRSAIVGIFCLLLGIFSSATFANEGSVTEKDLPTLWAEARISSSEVSEQKTDSSFHQNLITSSLPFDGRDDTKLTKEEWELELIVTTFSRHMGVRNSSRDWLDECDRKRPNGRTVYNECNWGLGVRLYHTKGWLGGKRFTDVFSLKNSLEGTLTAIGTGVLYEIWTIGDFTFTGSLEVLAGHYTRRRGPSQNLVGITFEPGVQYKKILSVNFSCVPDIDFKQVAEVCNLNFRFPFTL